MDAFPCPRCGKGNLPKYHAAAQRGQRMYYKCIECRCHYCVLVTDGFPPHVIAQSGIEGHPTKDPMPITNMGCPSCGHYGRVKMTTQRVDGYWRRHQCDQCGPYYTCRTDEGVAVHKKLKSLRAG